MTAPARAPELHVRADADAAAATCAGWIAEAAAQAVAARGRFVVALAGGSTPAVVYARLAGAAGARVDWARTHVWFGDERCVPPDDAASNYGMARRALLERVPVPDAQVHRLRGELAPADAAARADAELRAFAAAAPDAGAPGAAAFDLVLLGAGPDGHVASLFPGSPALDERARLVVATRAPAGMAVADRLTLTLPALGDAREVLLLATGAAKRPVLTRALREVADGDAADAPLPVARVAGRARTRWLLDAAAAPDDPR